MNPDVVVKGINPYTKGKHKGEVDLPRRKKYKYIENMGVGLFSQVEKKMTKADDMRYPVE